MPEIIGADEFVRMLRKAVDKIRENHELLSKLDSHGGDGDHGTTMVRAMEKVEKAVNEFRCAGVKDLLYNIGWAVMGVDGGATGPLFGMFFLSMSNGAGDGESLDAPGVAACFDAGLSGVQKQTKARVGDKTLIDALVPAVEAFRRAAEAGAGIKEAMEAAAQAAQRGARSTRDLQARFGRAKNIGEESRGVPDPGATSVSLIFRGFCDGLQS